MSAVEQIFGNLGRSEGAHFKGSNAAQSFYDPDDPDSYESYLQALMSDAADYEDSYLSGQRSELQLYYEGQSPALDDPSPSNPYVGADPNSTLRELLDGEKKARSVRSTFVSTDVRDAIMLVLPSLMRLFGASESPVTIVPRTEAETETCRAGDRLRQLRHLERQSRIFELSRGVQGCVDGSDGVYQVVDRRSRRDAAQDVRERQRRSRLRCS